MCAKIVQFHFPANNYLLPFFFYFTILCTNWYQQELFIKALVFNFFKKNFNFREILGKNITKMKNAEI